MTLILDAAPLVALADAEEPQLEALLRIRDEEEGPLVLPAPVAAEVDYLLGVRFGHAARRAFLSDLAAWRYDVACLEAGDYRVVAELDARYSDLGLGLADCAIAVLAERYETRRLFSFDERHFRAVAPLQGGSFALLPADLTEERCPEGGTGTAPGNFGNALDPATVRGVPVALRRPVAARGENCCDPVPVFCDSARHTCPRTPLEWAR